MSPLRVFREGAVRTAVVVVHRVQRHRVQVALHLLAESVGEPREAVMEVLAVGVHDLGQVANRGLAGTRGPRCRAEGVALAEGPQDRGADAVVEYVPTRQHVLGRSSSEGFDYNKAGPVTNDRSRSRFSL